MKILYDYAAFLMQSRGGVSRMMNEIIRQEMTREGVDCHVYAGFHKNDETHQLAQQFPGRVHGWFLPRSIAKQRLFMPINQALFASFAKRFAPDICHYTFFKTPPVPSKTKVVITVNDLISEIFSKGQRDPQIEDRKRALAKADGIVCISENTKQDLLRLYDMGNKPVIAFYLGNSLRFSAAKSPDMTTPYFLYVGMRGGPYKNLEIILEALKRFEMLAPFSLVCFGGGPFTKAEREMLKKAKLSERVIYRGGSDEALAGYYKNATALIYPSKYEGFGLPPIEAMGFGCPVLASMAPPMPEIIGDAALFFDPNSVEHLAEVIRTLLTEKGVRESLVERGRQREQFFSWEKAALQIHNFYCSL
jgi:glycosyltransferase involved in cell wall biosynthesis